VSLHAVTTTRAINYAYRKTGDDQTRKLLLLQNAALLPMFRDAAERRGGLEDAPIDQLQPIRPEGTDDTALSSLLSDLGGRRRTAAQKILGYLQADRPAEPLLQQLFELVAHKGNGAHDFKFTSAALECFGHVTEPWRARYLACGAMHFCGPDERDNDVVRGA
jgi:hypothetical protein